MCFSSEGMRSILYGLPDGPPDESQVVLGGCCIEESDPEDACVDCGWRGTLGQSQRRKDRD